MKNENVDEAQAIAERFAKSLKSAPPSLLERESSLLKQLAVPENVFIAAIQKEGYDEQAARAYTKAHIEALTKALATVQARIAKVRE